jgi:hypothetical protein
MSKNTDATATPAEEALQNPLLSMQVQPDSDLKRFIVEYVGTKFEKPEVTVEMIAEALAEDFPEFLYVIAEENFIRGYETGLDDVYRTIAREASEKPTEE